jgi:RimJ/RimL family protein N-acetyltransferase
MPTSPKDDGVRVTERLRLEPITRNHAQDYCIVFQDDAVAAWYAGKLSLEEARREVSQAERIWKTIGFHKWLVYERASGEVVGRAGVSAMPIHAYDGAIRSLLPKQAWADEARGDREAAHLARRWVEIGWALRGAYWGRGYASELGRYGLRFAFDELDMRAVISFTERHNLRSRGVMERIGMTDAGEFVGTGLIEGRAGTHDEAPFSLYLALRESWPRKG